jgi:hypothetical protein
MGRKQINHFVINFNKKTSFGFHALALNYFVDEVLMKKKDGKTFQVYFRLFRTGIIGDILYKKGQERVTKENFAEMQFLAALFESYLFLVRSIYDYLLHFLKESRGVKDTHYKDFINKIKKGKYPEIEGKLREYLIKTKIFEEVRDLRDSIKWRTANIDIYVKNNIYWVSGIIYKRAGEKESFNERLGLKIFGYTAGLFILMSYMAENLTGVQLKEQLKIQKRKLRKH